MYDKAKRNDDAQFDGRFREFSVNSDGQTALGRLDEKNYSPPAARRQAIKRMSRPAAFALLHDHKSYYRPAFFVVVRRFHTIRRFEARQTLCRRAENLFVKTRVRTYSVYSVHVFRLFIQFDRARP